MANINSIVNVVITRESARITRAGFGTALVLGVHNKFDEAVRKYNDIAGVGEDFASTDEVYVAAAQLFGQQISPASILVGKRNTTAEQSNIITIGGTPAEGDVYTVTVNRNTYTYTAPATPTTDSVATGIQALIDADTEIDAAVVASDITCTPANVGSSFLLSALATSILGTIVIAEDTGTVETIADSLDAIDAENPAWYALVVTKRGAEADRIADILETAIQSEARTKLYGCSSSQASAITTADDDVFSVLKGLNYDRTFGFYSTSDLNYPEAAIFGLQLPKTAGTTNWKFKQIKGVPAEVLTATQANELLGKRANFVEEIKGVAAITSEGNVMSGEYIDVIRGVDSTQAEIGEDIYVYLLSQEKVPFTDTGISAIMSLVFKVLDRKSKIGLYVASSLKVQGPKAADVPTAEKANRQLFGVTFSAQLQGAVNYVEIKGKVYP